MYSTKVIDYIIELEKKVEVVKKLEKHQMLIVLLLLSKIVTIMILDKKE